MAVENSFIISLLLKLNDALTKPLLESRKKSTEALKKMGQDWEKTGKTMTRTITAPFLLIAGLAVRAIDQQEQAEAKLRNALRLTGKESESTMKNLIDYASELQKVTTFGDEASLSAMAFVQQMGNLSEMQLKKLLPGMQDFAASWNMDLEMIAKLTGKTLSSSQNAFARYGLELDSTMSKQEKLTKINEFFATKFAGTAEVLAKKGIGPLKQLKNAAGDMLETIGAIVLPFLNDLINNFLRPIIAFISNLDSSTKSMILTVLALAAAAGPLLVIAGKLIKMFSVGISPVQGFFMALAALAAIVIAVNEAVSKSLVQYENKAKAIETEIKDSKKLADEYDNLGKKTNLNAREKQRMSNIEKTLKERIGETVFQIDKETGALILNRKEFKTWEEERTKLVMDLKKKQVKQYEDIIDALWQYLAARKSGVKEQEQFLRASQAIKDPFLGIATVADIEDRITSYKIKMFELKEEVAGAEDALNDMGKSVDDLGDEFDKLGDKEEVPLLQIPTKMRNMMKNIKVEMSDPKNIEALSKQKTDVNVTIKVETDKDTTATIQKFDKKGGAKVDIRTGALLDGIGVGY